MWALMLQALRFLAQAVHRFIEANPHSAYEEAIFQALRTIIITAFLKPFRGIYGTPEAA